jgi:DNA sulfur modification protein DndD
MKISRIKLTNFRQHRNVDVDLSSSSSDITVIKGTMGAGKTNFLNAVTWAIYGDAGDSNVRELQLLSHSTIEAMQTNDYAKVVVEVGLEIDSNTTAFIVRSQDFQKRSETEAVAFGASELTVSVLRSVDRGFEVEPNPERWIDRNLPRRFRPYFLFDGEKLERFFQDSDSPKIRSAIQEVAQIDVLDRLQIGLAQASTDAFQRLSRLAGADGSKLSDELGRISSEAESETEKIRKLTDELSKASDLEVELDTKLVSFGALEANIKQKRKLDTAVQEQKANLELQKVELEKRLRKVAPSVFMAKALKYLEAEVDDAKRKQILPPPVSNEYLNSLLSRGTCICGSSLHEGTSGQIHLEEVIAKYNQVSDVGSVLYELSTPNSNVISRLTPEFDLVEDKTEDILRIMNRISIDEEELRSLAIQLEGVDDAEQVELARRRNEARQKVESTKNAIRTAEGRKDILQRQATDLRIQIQKIENTNKESQKALKRAQFAQELARQAFALYQKMNDQVRRSVADSLDEQFKQLTWKKDYFDQVSIDQNFKVSVTNNRGFEVLYDLSAGERLCLAFAFSLTLSKEAGLNFPIIVDTPMGRLAPEVQQNLAQVICDATLAAEGTDNHQIILLMTETEYNTQVEKVLDQRHPLVLQIYFDEKLSETEVK